MPQPAFKKISNISSIDSGYLIRFTPTKDNIVKGKLRPDYVVRNLDKELRDFSNNLLGTFAVDHSHIEINSKSEGGYFTFLWERRSVVKTPRFGLDFNIDDARGYFFLKIKTCLKAEIPHENEGIITCEIIHTPTNSNFWHFSLRWYYNGIDIYSWKEQEKKGTQRLVIGAAKAFIIEKAEFEIPSYSAWDKSLYH